MRIPRPYFCAHPIVRPPRAWLLMRTLWRLCESDCRLSLLECVKPDLLILGRISAGAPASVVGLMRISLSCAFGQNACECWNYGDLFREEGVADLQTLEDKGTLQSWPLPASCLPSPSHSWGDGTDRTRGRQSITAQYLLVACVGLPQTTVHR